MVYFVIQLTQLWVGEWSFDIGSASTTKAVSGVPTNRQRKKKAFTRSILDYQVLGCVDLLQQRNYIGVSAEIEVTTQLSLQ